MIMITTDTITKKAESYCERTGARMTDPRRYVLYIVSKTRRAMTAYEILESLGEFLDKPKPPTAYRAIEFWTEAGFLHRIESLNAYILCSVGHTHDGSQFMICDNCGDVTEAHLCHLPDSLDSKAKKKGFNVKRWSVELHGQCARCTDNG
jgi:Fur family zinc uptake transcriptional regulator